MAKVVGTDDQAILENVTTLLEDKAAYWRMAQATNPYGDGRAAGRIVQAILAAPSCVTR